MSVVTGPPPESLAWLAPSPMWHSSSATGTGIDEPGFDRPWLVEFDSDAYMDDFLSELELEEPPGPAAIGARTPADGRGTNASPYVLYQPLHGRYYLVAGSLVCRRIGLPDRAVQPRGQRVSFVVRRLGSGGTTEYAWVPKGSHGTWHAVVDPRRLHEGEDQLPMHAAPLGAPVGKDVEARLLGLDEPGIRTVWFGYVPVASRVAKPVALADPVAALAASSGRAAADDGRLMEFRLRVAGPWGDLIARRLIIPDAVKPEPSLFILLDLRDWLDRWVPAVLGALTGGTALAGGTPAESLRAALAGISVRKNGAGIPLRQALNELASYAPLVTGASTSRPADKYRVDEVSAATIESLGGNGEANGGLVLAALKATTGATARAETVPPELANMIVPRPAPGATGAAAADRFVLRLVYQHEPCEPVLSQPSAITRFAANYDPDAPARPIRIELPDPTNLRKFKRGVAMDMPPALRQVLDRVTPGVLKGDPLAEGGGQWDLGMICSFSIQIIFLVAFIVMFIFLILLNIVFWWLAFLKICFPVPRKS